MIILIQSDMPSQGCSFQRAAISTLQKDSFQYLFCFIQKNTTVTIQVKMMRKLMYLFLCTCRIWYERVDFFISQQQDQNLTQMVFTCAQGTLFSELVLMFYELDLMIAHIIVKQSCDNAQEQLCFEESFKVRIFCDSFEDEGFPFLGEGQIEEHEDDDFYDHEVIEGSEDDLEHYCISIIICDPFQSLLQRMKKSKLDAFEEDSQHILRELERNYLEVLTTLGYGTFGRVKLVKFRGKEEVYALKIMRKQEILQQNQLMHLHSQKQVLLQINHPNIVALKSTFQDPKHIYMMFQYIQGGQLFARLTRNGRFNDHTAMFYVAGVLDAICHLHSHDIVFRDLKPENIMVDSEGFPKLIDLGFAKKLHHLRTFTICGTPEYLAPEMLEKTNKSGYGKAVDYWGIGILIYELLAGYPPFYDNEQPKNIYKKIIKGVIEFPQFFSLRAKHIILSLLNPNPTKRLGARNNGDDIKQHAWFRKFDWNDIRNAKVPWKPPIKDPHDATNFQQVSASRGTTVSIPQQDQNLFQGF